jgi:hypothetical protein
MTEADKILKMIKAVDVNDTDTLDEIDARVWCYDNNEPFDDKRIDRAGHHLMYAVNTVDSYFAVIPRPTRSRDALKSIRPEGWTIKLYNYYDDTPINHHCAMQKSTKHFVANNLPSEELAELHAIIQAISYEREQNDQ